MKVLTALSAILLLLNSVRPALAASATDQVKSTADKVLEILRDPDLKGDAKRADRNRMILDQLDARFDWTSICRSCLGAHWRKFNRAQQTEFMDLFKKFLEHTYLDRIEPYYNELDKIQYQGERHADDNYARH